MHTLFALSLLFGLVYGQDPVLSDSVCLEESSSLPCLTCLPNAMQFCVAHATDYAWVWDRDWNCKSADFAVPQGGTVSHTCLQTKMDECGTTAKETDGWMAFSNEAALQANKIVWDDENMDVTRYAATCLFSRNMDVSLVIERDNEKTVDISADIKIDVRMDMCTDATCATKLDHPMEMNEKQSRFYISVEAPTAPDDWTLGFKRCTVAPDAQKSFEAVLIENGCGVNGMSFVMTEQAPKRTLANMRAFAMTGSDFIYLHCTLELCDPAAETCQLCGAVPANPPARALLANVDENLAVGPMIMPQTADFIIAQDDSGKYVLQDKTEQTPPGSSATKAGACLVSLAALAFV
eukprot:Platyproteum_vivax@DN5986_c0_g1_i1.p1